MSLAPVAIQARDGAKKVAIPLKKVPDLRETGGGALIRLKGKSILLIRTNEDTVAALDPVCTHKACDVLYKKDWGEIRCDCHGSTYDVQGRVTNPPAELNLSWYRTTLEQDRIVLSLEMHPGAAVGQAEE